jgi:hypothetical protein
MSNFKSYLNINYRKIKVIHLIFYIEILDIRKAKIFIYIFILNIKALKNQGFKQCGSNNLSIKQNQYYTTKSFCRH